MSNTRHATGNGPLRQERYASSEEYERGLNALMVSMRCTVLDAADRELMWFIQLLSHEPGGLKKLIAELCALFPDRVATFAMQRLGTKPGQIYNAKQVEQVRQEIPDGRFDYPLKGEIDDIQMMNCPEAPLDPVELLASRWKQERDDFIRDLEWQAEQRPASYPVATFASRCQDAAAAHLERRIEELCLNPELPIDDASPWYFPTLVKTLREYMAQWVAAKRASVAITRISEQISEEIDFACESGRLVLIVGEPTTGKTTAARAHCEQHPGSMRYVQVPSTNDEIGFFREIAKALGIASGLGWKAVQLRARIEEVLQRGQLTIVFDQAHNLFPTNDCRNTMPGRISWVETALVKKGVSVALISTPQFIKSLQVMERVTAWNAGQMMGHMHYVRLEGDLTIEDVQAIAKAMFPAGDAASVRALALAGHAATNQLGFLVDVFERALFTARRAARRAGSAEVGFADIKRAMNAVGASGKALQHDLVATEKPRRKVSAAPLQTEFTRPAVPEETPDLARGVRPVAKSNPNRLETVPG